MTRSGTSAFDLAQRYLSKKLVVLSSEQLHSLHHDVYYAVYACVCEPAAAGMCSLSWLGYVWIAVIRYESIIDPAFLLKSHVKLAGVKVESQNTYENIDMGWEIRSEVEGSCVGAKEEVVES
jgi:hypothetical protein